MWLPAVVAGEALVPVIQNLDYALENELYLWLLATLPFLILIFAPMGLPSALLCRELWRLGYRRTALAASVLVVTVTMAMLSLPAELGGRSAAALRLLVVMLPIWIVVYPAVFSLFLGLVLVWLRRRGGTQTTAES